MSELSIEDQQYVTSTRSWVRGEKNLIDQLNIQIENSSKMIKNHNESLAIAREQLEHEHKYLSQTEAAYKEWCATKGVEPDIEF